MTKPNSGKRKKIYVLQRKTFGRLTPYNPLFLLYTDYEHVQNIKICVVLPAIFDNTVKLGYNELGYNELGC